ncbi:hypothetical protein G4O51_12740 [Candidatus Bathyarchaeota archaeon A05DMB-2]|nr:hypothetical protein [Candidatus Bathyarchaeota archaeon A05DMB-2]
MAFVSLLFLSASPGISLITQATYEQTTKSNSVNPFPQAGKFYTLAGRGFDWAFIDGENVTTDYWEEIHKWSVQDVVGDVVLVNRTYVLPQAEVNYVDTEDFDYEIAVNRTILSAYWKGMAFASTGFLGSDERSLDEDVGEHTWAWFSTDLYIGAYILVSWTGDHRFLGDMLYEVVDEEVIEILGEKQESWMVRMPPVVTVDGTQGRTETYWVDKDTGIPLKLYTEGWVLDGSSGLLGEFVLVNTNIDLGPESTEEPSPTYTLTVPTTPGFPEAGKFYTWYYLEDGWYMSGAANITYYNEGLFTWWVADVTGTEALVYRIFWYQHISEAGGAKELEAVEIQCYNYTMDINTREILRAAGLLYRVNTTSLAYEVEDRTPQLVGDVGEETYCWLPKNLNIGATVNITWTIDWPDNVDNGTYTVTGEKIINALGKPQACWILYMPPTPSINGKWNISETYYSDKDVGTPLGGDGKGWAVDGNSAYSYFLQFIDTNIDLGPKTYVFQVVADGQTFYVVVVTNSTVLVETFAFSQGDMKISYNVTGASDTAGFCNVTIPMALLRDNPWTVKVGNLTITPIITDNDTHNFLYFNYNHSTYLVEISGTWVIPEFPSAIILPLFMVFSVIGIVFAKKKLRKQRSNFQSLIF